MVSNYIWWTTVSNSKRFLSDAVSSLLDRRSVIMISEQPLPYASDFYDHLSEEIRINDSQTLLESIPARLADEYALIDDFMFDQYCPRSVESDYFPAPNYSKANFLAQYDKFQLNRRIVYVSGINDAGCKKWVDFLSRYSRFANDDSAVFVFEISGVRHRISEIKNCSKLLFDEYITEYDRYVYSLLLTADSDIKNSETAKYIAELITNISGKNIELYSSLVSVSDEIAGDPFGVCRRFADTTLTESDANVIIWKTQLKHVFPLIEAYRRKIVDKYKKTINKALPYTTPYNVTIENPYELDFGNIAALINEKKLKVSDCEFSRITLCKDVRNSLAHLKCADNDSVMEIFNTLC